MGRTSAIARTVAEGVGSILFMVLWVAPVPFWLLLDRGILDRGQLAAATAYTFLVAAWGGWGVIIRLRKRRRLRERGVVANATIVGLHENYAAIRSGYTGWTTTVTVAFTDESGESIRATYPYYYTRASAFTEGASLQVRYDPQHPTEITVGEEDSRGTEAYVLMLPGAVMILGLASYFTYRVVSW
jgi:hypothetical protein